MTKFLQRVQLGLWAVAIIMGVVFQFTGLKGELSGVPVIATYIFNMMGVVLLLAAGYCVLAQRKHRVLRLTAVNLTILCTEALYFMMTPSDQSTTMMYCFLVALLLSLVAYPINDPKKPEAEPLAEEVPATEEPATEEPAEEPAIEEPIAENPNP